MVAGQGQTVRVSGVRIGDIGGVELKDGRAVITMDIDPEYADLVHSDASALLRPKTGLKDMFIDLEPGTDDAPRVKAGWTIPIRATQPDVNPDEIFSVLDTDTRDYLQLLVNGPGKGLHGRGGDLQDIFARFEPTHRDLARVTGAVATRRKNLRHLISSLNKLNTTLASRDDDLAKLVDSSAAVFRAFASEESNVSAAVHELPAALSQTTDTLQRVQTFAELLRPTADKLRPAARALDPANRAVRPFAAEAPAAREPHPAARARGAPARARPRAGLDAPGRRHAGPDPGVHALNHFLNLLGYNQNGREGPRRGRPPGGLPVLAGVGQPPRHPGVLELRRPRDAAARDDRRSLRDDQAARRGAARARVPRDADAGPHGLGGLRDGVGLMQKTAPSVARVMTMVVFTLSCFGLLLFLWLSFGGPIPLKPKGYRVQVAFPEATTLGLEADVRVAGVSVGKVAARTSTMATTARWSTSSSTASSRRCAPTRARSCARRRCWARPTSS